MNRATISPEEAKVIDVNSSYLGVKTITLMENAGAAVAKHVLENYDHKKRVAVICGKGNNGGDGFVAARYLGQRMAVAVFLAEREEAIESRIALVNLDKVRSVAHNASAFDSRQHDLVVDAMLGIGTRGRPREPYASMIRKLNRSRRPVVSVDVPSGWPSDLAVKPESTITFHAQKTGMTMKRSGRIVVADIGIPPDAATYCGPGDFTLLPQRRRNAHKGEAGRVLVIGGGPYTGAPAFTGMAAMRSGVDLAFVATPEPAAIPVAVYSPNIIVKPLKGDILCDGHVNELLAFAKGVDVVAIGPGLGRAPETLSAVQKFVSKCTRPLVIDADAIAAVGAKPHVLKGRKGVITPHLDEFRRLTGKTLTTEDLDRRGDRVEEAAAKLKMTILLKGAVDVISDGSAVKLNRTGNTALTVGGTGDVLTGIVAGMIAQGAAPFAAARIGAFCMGLAGDLAFSEKDFGMLATDVIEKVPIVLRRFSVSADI